MPRHFPYQDKTSQDKLSQLKSTQVNSRAIKPVLSRLVHCHCLFCGKVARCPELPLFNFFNFYFALLCFLCPAKKGLPTFFALAIYLFLLFWEAWLDLT